MSDSPPEKDVQWSEEGIVSSFKFIQKLWTLNFKIMEKIKEDQQQEEDEITKYTNKFLKKITENLESFSYNKIIANLYEMYSFMSIQMKKNYKKQTLIENYQKILIAMQPIIPHFSNECLELINNKNNTWPNYDENFLKEEEINIVIQINGRKRGLIEVNENIDENNLIKLIKEEGSISKYLENSEIKRKIFVKNKLLNLIIKMKIYLHCFF